MSRIKNFEMQSGSMRLLIHLLKGPSYATLILKETDIPNTQLFRSLDLLKEMGMIRTEIDKSVFPNRNMIYLTTKGMKVAEHLKHVEEILEN